MTVIKIPHKKVKDWLLSRFPEEEVTEKRVDELVSEIVIKILDEMEGANKNEDN